MSELARMWESLGPELQTFVILTVAGVLGAVAGCALDHKPLVFPRLEEGHLHLGFMGNLVISVVAAHAVDHGFGTGLLAAVAGNATLKRLKRHIDMLFDEDERPSRVGRR